MPLSAAATGLDALAPALRSGELAIGDYLDQVEARFAESEPGLQAWLPEEGRFARVRREASELEARFPQPNARPPLFGVPFGVKDIFHVDGFETRAGSRLPPAELRGEEAMSVRALRGAGALVLGKTVSTEFAYFAPGPTRNPHHLEHTPGGSSSGSAAAVAAGLCPLALGTQTIGSILRPASFCGIVGFKPSYERTWRDGVVPLAPSLDHVGCFASSAAGVALAAAVLCRGFRPAVGVVRPRLAVPVGPYLERTGEEMRRCLEAARAALRGAGFELREVSVLADFTAIEARHRLLVAAEAARVHEPWFERFRELYAPATVELIERGRAAAPAEVEAARAGRGRLRRELGEIMDRGEIDLWLAPAAVGAAPHGLDSTGDPVMNLPWTYAGMPAIALPAGRDPAGLPLGLQLVGRFGDDERLLAWAVQIESWLAPEPAP